MAEKLSIQQGKGTIRVGEKTTIKVNQGDVTINQGDIYGSEQRGYSKEQTERVLKQLQESLRTLFSSQNAWFVPFPWMTSNCYEAEDYFVKLDLEELNRNGTQIRRENIPWEALFLSNSEGSMRVLPKGPRRILLQGDAGYGKTTMCVKIAHDWALDNIAALQKFKLVILLRLRSMRASLNQSVINFCLNNLGTRVEENLIKEIISDLGSEVLLILDGLDEINDEKLGSIQDLLTFNQDEDFQETQPNFLRTCTFVFTTRPNRIPSSFYTLIDRNARIRMISNPDTFLNTYFKDPKDVKNLKAKISKMNFASMWSPLLLYIMCYLHENGQFGLFDHEYDLLKAMLRLLSQRCMYREGLSYYEHEQWELFLKLGKLFISCLEKNKYYIEDETIKAIFKEDEHFIKACGVLKQPPKFEKRESASYEPVHKIFLEFLAVSYLNQEIALRSVMEKKKFISNLVMKYSRYEARVKVYDKGEDQTVTIFTTVIILKTIYVMVTAKKTFNPSPSSVNIEFVSYRSVLRFQKVTDRDPKLVKSETVISLRNKNHATYFPRQFRHPSEYFLTFDNGENFRYKFILHIFRDCRCFLEAPELPLIYPDSHVGAYPSISNFRYTEGKLNCEFCKGCCQRTVKMLLRSTAISHTIILSCNPQLLFNSDQLLQSVFQNDCSVQAYVRGVSDGDVQLETMLSHLLQHGLRCTDYNITDSTDFGSFVLQLTAKVITTSLDIPVTVTIKNKSASFTFIPDTTTKAVTFYSPNSQTKETFNTFGRSSRILNFLSTCKQSLVKGGLFKVSLTVAATSAFLQIDCFNNDSSEDVVDGNTYDTVTFQILRNKSYRTQESHNTD